METIICGSVDDIKERTRLKCGEVFILNYGEDTCAVECMLCEERPICSLTTYLEHLQIWHSDWRQYKQTNKTEEKRIALYDTTAERNDWEDEDDVAECESCSSCEPFEEVLIQIEDENQKNFAKNLLTEESIHTNEECRESYTTDDEEIENGENFAEESEELNREWILNEENWIEEFKRSIYDNQNSNEFDDLSAVRFSDEHENTAENCCDFSSACDDESEINYEKLAYCNENNFKMSESTPSTEENKESENHCLRKIIEENCVVVEPAAINSILQTTDSGVAINYKLLEAAPQSNTLTDENYFLEQQHFSEYDLIEEAVTTLPLTASSEVLLNCKPTEVEQLNAINEQVYKCLNTALKRVDNAHTDSGVAMITDSDEVQANYLNEENPNQMQTSTNTAENEFCNSISNSSPHAQDSDVSYNLKPSHSVQFNNLLTEYNPTEVDIITNIASSTPLSEDSGVALNFMPNTFEGITNLFENDCDLSKDNSPNTRSEDSGLEKSDTCSLTASTSHTASEDDEEVSCDLHSFNIKEQVRFGLSEPPPKPKLTSADMAKVIELYRAHPRLWQQNHAEYNEPQLCRESWEEITAKWNQLCQLDFHINDVRIRVSTLCQRYLKERQRREMELEGEQSKLGTIKRRGCFNYFEQLKFLDMADKSPYKKRIAHISQEHSKLVEIYAQFPILWHTDCPYRGRSKRRQKAYVDISTALRPLDIHLSPARVRRRLTLLKKRYRIEKMRHLKCRLDRKTFEKHFKHYDEMNFLDNHIAPFVCNTCGKIFQKYKQYERHKKSDDNCGDIDVNIIDSAAAENDDLNVQNNAQLTKMLCEDNCKVVEASRCHAIIENNGKFESSDNSKNVINTEAKNESDIRNDYNINLINITTNTSEHSNKSEEDKTDSNDKDNGCDISEVNKSAVDLDYKPPSAKRNIVKKTKRIDYRRGTAEQIPDEHLRGLISLFREYTQLWNSDIPNFSSRRSKTAAWRTLTTQFNDTFQTNYPWTLVQQRIMHYVRYYRRETRRIEARGTCTSWLLYDDLKFLDKTFGASSELEKRITQRTHTLKIIEIYKEHPELWDTTHAEYTKRKQRQLSINLMCTQLQTLHDITIEQDKLKQRLLDLRSSFRTTKLAKISAEKRNETFNAITQFEFYDELQFLEAHLAPFICQICAISFDRFSDFRGHQRKEHTRRTRRRKPLTANDIDKGTLENVCHVCGIEFTLRHNLVQHLNRHFAERTLSCKMCGKKFFTSTSLQEHERIHTKVPAVICAECGQTFVNASKLNQHMKRHRNQRDYACKRCEKAFYTAFELDRHMDRHLNIRNKVCPVCNKAFVMGSAYYTHIKLHNEKKQYSCAMCNKEFAQHAGLYKHRKKYHPQD